MEMNFVPSIAVEVRDQTQIAEARRAAQLLAEELGFTEVRRTELGIVATELARNALVHGGSGHVLIMPNRTAQNATVDIIAMDKGPGILDLEKCLQDGYSTAGTPGTGLGAVSRMANQLQVFSAAKRITAVLAEVQATKSSNTDALIGALCLPIKGERVSGDAWGYRNSPAGASFVVIDGLGHGAGAAEAAHEALNVFFDNPLAPPAELLRDMHDALMKTRGAAIAIAQADALAGTLRFTGVGNISAYILSPGKKPRAMVSHNGTVGHVVSRIQEFNFPWEKGDLLVMHSDGVSSHWDLDAFPGLFNKHPAMIADVIHQQAVRGRDDATTLVARLGMAA
jgi:anti-sigma regulatory factor (Ser/Thr protein kinase)